MGFWFWFGWLSWTRVEATVTRQMKWKKNPARISNYIGTSGSKMKQKIYCTLTCMWNCERNEFYRSISDASYAFFARCTCHFGANKANPFWHCHLKLEPLLDRVSHCPKFILGYFICRMLGWHEKPIKILYNFKKRGWKTRV